jgi:hypothetical protein
MEFVMKVYIGPYPFDHIRAYALYDKYVSWKYKKPYWSVDEDELSKLDKFLEKAFDRLQDVLDASINRLLNKRKQKIKIRIDPHDVWSMDNTLASIIHPMLIELKKAKHGGPYVDDEDVPENLRSTNAKPREPDEVDEFHFDRWDWVLDEMIWTFETLNTEWSNQFYTPPKGEWGEGNYGSFDSEGREKMQKRINNGLRLFGKYYQSLWD